MANVQRTQSSAQQAKRKAAPAAAKQATEAKRTPTSDEVAARAYAIWEENGCPEGTEQEDWYQAERELAAAHDE
jgi:hypothetical protein